MSAAANISQLQQLPLPEAVSYLPQTWGWLALLLILLAVGLLFAARKALHWRRNRYRRAALMELAQLHAQTSHASTRLHALRQLPELLKRTALSMPQQPAVESLCGAAWQHWLQQRNPTSPLPADFNQQLAHLAYAPPAQIEQLDAGQIAQLFGHCQAWLEQHHVAV